MSWKFSVDELSYCIRIGTERQATNMRNCVPSKQFTQRDPTAIHIQGVLGEFAFAKLCSSLSTDTKDDVTTVLNNTKSRSGKKDTFDWSAFGKRIDVKTTLNPYSTSIYARRHKSDHPADLYVLIMIEFIDPKTNRVFYVQDKDQMFAHVQKDPTVLTVQATFRGWIPSALLFHPAKFNNDGNGGSFVATPISTQWTDFCAQFSPSVVPQPLCTNQNVECK
jgi:hypothetical protein